MRLLDGQNSKNQKFVIDKIFHPLEVHFDTHSLSAWLSYYYSVHVMGAPEKTEQAKMKEALFPNPDPFGIFQNLGGSIACRHPQ